MKHTEKNINQNNADGDAVKSKTQLKQEAEVIRKLGLKLLDLSASDLATIPLSPDLLDALNLANRINRKKDGFRRQIQFIGKLLREEDVEPIQHALVTIQNRHQLANAHFHKLEQQRDALIRDGDEAIQSLLTEHPQVDRQKLRQLIRQAKKQAQENKPPKASREIFQYLKDTLEK